MSKTEMPKYLKDKMMLADDEHGKLIFRMEPYVDAPDNSESFVMGYQQAYADIISELGPVIESLKLIANTNLYVGENGWVDEHLLDVKQANEALEHLEKIGAL